MPDCEFQTAREKVQRRRDADAADRQCRRSGNSTPLCAVKTGFSPPMLKKSNNAASSSDLLNNHDYSNWHENRLNCTTPDVVGDLKIMI